MEEIFKQYGGPIITALVVVGIVVIVGILLSTGKVDGVIIEAFESLITQFQGKANGAIDTIGKTSTIMIM